MVICCDLLKIHYLCGDKDNKPYRVSRCLYVVICSKFITFAVTKTTAFLSCVMMTKLWFAQNSLPLRWQRQPSRSCVLMSSGCDLLKIHYLCGDKDNYNNFIIICGLVVICSKFITFAVTKTTQHRVMVIHNVLWFAQNSLPLRWQRQPSLSLFASRRSCDLLKIHYLCGDKDNVLAGVVLISPVVICSKFITFAVTKTTYAQSLA